MKKTMCEPFVEGKGGYLVGRTRRKLPRKRQGERRTEGETTKETKMTGAKETWHLRA